MKSIHQVANRCIGWLVLFARSTLISLSTSTPTTPRVSRLPPCLLLPLQVLTLLTLPLIVSWLIIVFE